MTVMCGPRDGLVCVWWWWWVVGGGWWGGGRDGQDQPVAVGALCVPAVQPKANEATRSKPSVAIPSLG